MAEFKPFVGCFRRLIDLKTWDDHTVVGWLEDDFHHFGVTLAHDGHVVTDIRMAAVRYPWTPCPSAHEPLKKLIGQPLVERCTDIGKQADMRQQCTHVFDLLGLMSAHAFHRRDHHRYHATVYAITGDEAKSGWLAGNLLQDERPVMAWQLHDGVIMMPAEHAGQSVERGFREWTETLDEGEAERASVLRRAVYLAPVRGTKVRLMNIPDLATIPALCFTYQPTNRVGAERDGERSALRTYDAGPEGMLAQVATKP